MMSGGIEPPRRAVLAGALALASSRVGAATDPLAGAALYADVKTYAGLGQHRTGGPGDTRTTAWLVGALTRAGYQVTRQAFDYPVFDLKRADVRVDTRIIAAFPVWTPCPTPPGGITAPLSRDGGAGRIAMISLAYNPGASLELPAYNEPLRKAVAGGARAVIAITENPLGELMALNVSANAAPWAVPVLLVAGREGPALLAAAASGANATVRLEGETAIRPAHNVVGRRPGVGKTVVLSTPKSGWLACAGERGSGMAIWLGLARWLATETRHNLLVVSTSGHELNGYGGHMFTESLAPRPDQTRLWIHIGANVAAYDFAMSDGVLVRRPGPPGRRTLACSESLLGAAGQAFAGQIGYQQPVDIDVQRAPGEVALYQRLGYRPILGLVAAHPLHHTPRDLPDVTSSAVLAPVASGLRTFLSGLSAG